MSLLDPSRGQRKFALSLLALALSFILALFKVVEGGEWVTVVGLIVGLYGGANVAEHFAERPHNPNPTPALVPVATVLTAVDDATVTTTTHESGKKTETRHT